MTKDEAKQWLNRGWNLNKEIDALLSEQRQAFEIACGITSKLSDDKVQTTKNNSAESKFINYADYSKLIDDMFKVFQLVSNISRGRCTMIKSDCFAYSKTKCKALKKLCCKNCKFYKTEEQFKKRCGEGSKIGGLN